MLCTSMLWTVDGYTHRKQRNLYTFLQLSCRGFLFKHPVLLNSAAQRTRGLRLSFSLVSAATLWNVLTRAGFALTR